MEVLYSTLPIRSKGYNCSQYRFAAYCNLPFSVIEKFSSRKKETKIFYSNEFYNHSNILVGLNGQNFFNMKKFKLIFANEKGQFMVMHPSYRIPYITWYYITSPRFDLDLQNTT